ncbi:MAG TPA: 50S ribosomal protein L24 [Terriglobales bacterium]|jgi:large subunit ribosomal protein L24|nr:50S ribosomal protein L24 [Terriglobales bacterium]HVZ61259.1 50S ribosomal protein L24 [Terriglobales bacterium]
MATATATKKMNRDIRRNDNVQVIAGRDAGKQGRVLRVVPARGKVLVEHVMMVKKHVKPNPQRNIKGGIAEQEGLVDISNVMLVCGSCGPVRVGHDMRGERKVRVCKKCGTTLEK